MKKCVPDTNIY